MAREITSKEYFRTINLIYFAQLIAMTALAIISYLLIRILSTADRIDQLVEQEVGHGEYNCKEGRFLPPTSFMLAV